MCDLLGVAKTHCTPYHPRSNGLVERFNLTIENMLAKYMDNQQSDWDTRLGCLLMAYRAAPHSSTNVTPNMLTLGREVTLPIDLVFPIPSEHQGAGNDLHDYAENLHTSMLDAQEVARENLDSS